MNKKPVAKSPAKKENPNSKNRYAWLGYLITLGAIFVIIFVSWILYTYTVELLSENLRQRQIAIVQTAAVQFEAEDLDTLQVEGDWQKPEWARVVNQLIKIRLNNSDIVFAYILRKANDDPTQMVFVADSHSLNPYAKIDLDGNGVIDDADSLNWPGQIYEDVPEEAFEGYEYPVANKELYEDIWGVLSSGYAPIKDENGETVALMVVDIRANDFFEITRQTFLPFLAFIIVLIIILVILAGTLIRIWNKRIQLFAELDRQKDELLSIVSHQLATPVSSLKWYTEMMIDGDLGKVTKQQKEHLSSMMGVAGNLADLVSMILDVSRIQLGRVKIEKQQLDLNKFFKEILEIITPKAKEKPVKFNINIDKKLPKAMLDRRYTHMVIENLLSNAIKYTPKKGVVNFNVEQRGNTLYCEVTDTGCGIPKEDQVKIFGRMFRASNVRNSVDGNGFGLFVAKGAVEAQGGKIWFKSTPNKGTSFFVELPIKAKTS